MADRRVNTGTRRPINAVARSVQEPRRSTAIAASQTDRRLDDEGTDAWTGAQSMAAEMVKIAGVRFEKGQWDWKLENIPRYFQEEPVWATLDAVTLGLPAAKFAKGAYAVTRGATAVAEGYRAGEVGLREGMKMLEQVPGGKLSRFFSNPITREIGPEHRALMERFGASPAEKQALADVANREYVAEQGYWRSRTRDVAAKLHQAGIPEEQHERFIRALESATTPEQFAARETVEKLMSPGASEAYERTWKLREELGFEAEDLGMLDPERLTRQDSWMPHMVKGEYDRELTRAGYRAGSDVGEKASWDSFKRRKYSTEQFEELFKRDFDPTHGVIRMGQAAQAVARERYAQALIGSSVVKDGAEVLDHLLDAKGVLANDRLRKLWGISDDTAREIVGDISQLPRNSDGTPVDEALAQVLGKAGWVRLGDTAPGLKLPQKYADLFVDKKVAGDMAGTFSMTSGKPGLLGRIYEDAMAGFRASKTAYNPATHVRNIFGAFVFHHLAVGGRGMLDGKFLSRGWKLWKEGMDNPMFVKAAEAGVTGATFDAELRSAWREVFGDSQRVTALDFLGDSRVAKAMQKLGGKAEGFYRAIDEVTRLDAWARNYEKFKGVHKAKWAADELERRALDFATLETAKYIPSFSMHSPFSQMIRKHIPFASFSHEAVRVWKNALVSKPHLAMFWSHFADTAGEAMGAMAGYTPEEIESAKANLPYYQKGKKMLMWPFRVEGKPVFVDMSYLIPMANIVEVEREQSSFLGTAAGLAGVNPTSNPFVGILYAGVTGQDVFRGLPVEPKVTERQLGVPIEDERARTAVGLAEHVAATFLPPLVPPGYAGINMLEWARGQKHQLTGADLEDGFWRTLGTNVAGIRLHEADVNASMLNVANDERRMDVRVADWWQRWQWATANHDTKMAERAENNLKELRMQRGDTSAEADAYVAKGMHTREPGAYRNFPRQQVKAALERAKTLELGADPEDAKQIAAMAKVTRKTKRERAAKRHVRKKRGK